METRTMEQQFIVEGVRTKCLRLLRRFSRLHPPGRPRIASDGRDETLTRELIRVVTQHNVCAVAGLQCRDPQSISIPVVYTDGRPELDVLDAPCRSVPVG